MRTESESDRDKEEREMFKIHSENSLKITRELRGPGSQTETQVGQEAG